ncbi:gag-pol, partial [Mucuna pruriens]
MGPFPVSNNYSYIPLAVDYVEVVATRTNDAKAVVDFLKFGVPKALISDQGSHFCNRAMASLLQKYVTNGQPEVFNKEIKKTLQKMTNPSRKDWSLLLENALWAHRTIYRTPLGMSPYQIVFGKTCHLLVELEHKAYWVLQQLDELRLEAYENSRIYKQKVKKFHDQKILRKDFHVGQKVLVQWDGPFVITNIFPNGVVQLKDEHKQHLSGRAPIAGDMEIISLMEPAPPDGST